MVSWFCSVPSYLQVFKYLALGVLVKVFSLSPASRDVINSRQYSTVNTDVNVTQYWSILSQPHDLTGYVQRDSS